MFILNQRAFILSISFIITRRFTILLKDVTIIKEILKRISYYYN